MDVSSTNQVVSCALYIELHQCVSSVCDLFGLCMLRVHHSFVCSLVQLFVVQFVVLYRSIFSCAWYMCSMHCSLHTKYCMFCGVFILRSLF